MMVGNRIVHSLRKRQLLSSLCGQRYGIGAIAFALCSFLFAQAAYAEPTHSQALINEDDVDMSTKNTLQPDLSPGQSFKDCPDCPQMMVLPAGSFMMGSSGSDTVSFPHEQPQHEVTFAQPFALGVYEVTFGEWDACVRSGGCNGYRPKGRFFGRDWGRAQQPVMRIGWDDTRSYLAWLSDLTGETYRLPSVSRMGVCRSRRHDNTLLHRLANHSRASQLWSLFRR